MGAKGVGFFHSNSLWTLDYKFILAMCSKLHVLSEATTEAAQIHKVLYQWGRREQALHEEIHLQTCRTFMHLTSISHKGMVHVNLFLVKPTLNSSISSFNCPSPSACTSVSDVDSKVVLLNSTKALPKEHLCVHIKPPGLGKWWNNQSNSGSLCKEILDQGTSESIQNSQ